MKLLETKNPNFKQEWSDVLTRSYEVDTNLEGAVLSTIAGVRQRGDAAVREDTTKWDDHTPERLEVSREEIRQAYKKVERRDLESLKLAAKRINQFHKIQFSKLPKSWQMKKSGVTSGECILPLDRVGIYVPGGLAAYPSTVLMNSIPARIAGVREVVMVSPWPKGVVNPYTLVAADLAGVDRIFKIGGAQAIAALAYGTETIPAVDKIVGPGNIFVATAKKLVFGRVGIDSVAGPTEIVIVADDSAQAEFVASDLLSQAEHDPRATSILLTHSEKFAKEVDSALNRQLEGLERRAILKKALEGQGLLIKTRNLNESLTLSNQFAPEHLSLQIRNPEKSLPKIRNAGAIFLGPLSPVAFGDYLAGPNHVLPTSGTARFSSPLGVSDFLKRSSVVKVNQKAFEKLGPHVIHLAQLEGLTAHGASVKVRMKGKTS